MGEACWKVRGSELVRVAADQSESVPSADEIYSALVERRPVWDGMPAEVPGIRASRYPLAPVLTINQGENSVPAYALSGSSRGIEIPLAPDDLARGHLLHDGVWYALDAAQGELLGGLLSDTGIGPGPARSLKGFLHLRKKALEGGPVVDNLADQAISPLAFTPPAVQAPAGIVATLYSYQTAGWRWLQFLLSEGIGGLLADEMGLGKTLQIISVLSDSGSGSLSPSLIFAPGSLLENWRRELARFAPGLRVLKHHGPLRTGRPAELQAYDVVVTSYDSAVRDNSLLNMVAWRAIILDEAQYIRNPGAQRTQAVKHLRREVGLAVTGTPVENRLLDLWSIMDFVLPGYLGDKASFERLYTEDVDGAARLEPLVSPLILRRRVAEVAQDLPARIDIPQVIELEEAEAGAYEAMRLAIADKYGSAATLVALTTLRQFCAHPALLDRAGSSDPMAFSKFRRLDEILEEIFSLGEKVIIFTSYTRMADMIAAHVRQRFRAFAGIIDGRLAIDDRQTLIDQFGEVQGGAALVLNPKAGGTGLNITAANHVIHYNLEWNPALEDQASARAHRRGQELPVTVHRLFVADTVEDVVHDRMSRKRAISGTAVVGVEGRDEDYADIVGALSRSPVRKLG
ncbi:MAG: DEAD/DEAH box helicase [Mesorhizobium sp.]|nr:MAG: DEAD/DEAH box helicase [Mesorhizobium sp.]